MKKTWTEWYHTITFQSYIWTLKFSLKKKDLAMVYVDFSYSVRQFFEHSLKRHSLCIKIIGQFQTRFDLFTREELLFSRLSIWSMQYSLRSDHRVVAVQCRFWSMLCAIFQLLQEPRNDCLVANTTLDFQQLLPPGNNNFSFIFLSSKFFTF